MYPTLSHMLYDVFGIKLLLPFPMYGFILAITFILASLLFAYELKRREKLKLISATPKKILVGAPATKKEIIGSVITGFIVGFKVIEAYFYYDELIADPQSFILSWRGNFLGGLIAGGIFGFYTYWDKKRHSVKEPKWEDILVHPYQLTGNMVLIIALFSIIGAKLFHILEYFDDFLQDPIGMLVSGSGLTFYGGLIMATAAGIYYGKKHNILIPQLIDSAAPAMMFGYGMGRFGCHFSGDGDWGVIANWGDKIPKFLPEWFWQYNYPNNVIRTVDPNGNDDVFYNALEHMTTDPLDMGYVYQLAENVYPTSLWEALTCITVGIGLLFLAKHIKVPGLLFSIYLMLNGTERFLIEKIRVNIPYHIAGFEITQAEIISFVIFSIGVFLAWFFIKKYKKKPQEIN